VFRYSNIQELEGFRGVRVFRCSVQINKRSNGGRNELKTLLSDGRVLLAQWPVPGQWRSGSVAVTIGNV
jgi:hypothetical protein